MTASAAAMSSRQAGVSDDAILCFRARQAATDAGIDWTVRAVRCAAGGLNFPLNVGAGAEAGVGEAHAIQTLQRRFVFRQMVRLPALRLLVRAEPEPGQVGEHPVREFRLAAGRVDILDSHQIAPAIRTRCLLGEQGGVDAAEVQVASGRRGKTGDGHGAERLGLVRI